MDCLGSKNQRSFGCYRFKKYDVHIEQCMVRTYIITAEDEADTISIWNAFLQILVRSRNRIMHIKRNQPCGNYLSGTESILYMTKIL